MKRKEMNFSGSGHIAKYWDAVEELTTSIIKAEDSERTFVIRLLGWRYASFATPKFTTTRHGLENKDT